jgi:hypothetical protein
MKRERNAAQRLRAAVDLLPQHTREAMLRGIDENKIIVGSYTDGRGGVCPMLAAHRNGGRTNFSGFAKAWDRFAGADRARRATPHEIGTLRSYLQLSILEGEQDSRPLGEIVDEIRAERRRRAEEAAWSLVRSERRDAWDDLIATGEEVLAERESAAAHRDSPAYV